MKGNIENRDWLNDCKALKKVSPANPFTAPDGYFDGLEDRIVSYKNLKELNSGDLTGNFTVPNGYFEELTSNIQSRITIGDTISADNNGGFSIPAGYFDELSNGITSRIAIEEALGNREETFTVPAGYFDRLNKSILDKTIKQDSANREGVIRKLFATNAFKYATAACFALLIGGGILLMEVTSPQYVHTHSFLHKALSNVPVDEIKSYLQLNVDPGDAQQTVVAEGTSVNDDNLKKALQNYVDSVQ